MSCTLEQIAEKKRIAQERLLRARQQPNPPQPPQPPRSQPHSNGGNSARQFLTVNSFYATPPPNARPPNRDCNIPSPGRPSASIAAGGGGGKIRVAPTLPGHRQQPYAQRSSHGAGNSSRADPKKPSALAPVFLPTKSAVCSMVSAERFVVAAPFHAQMLDVFKTMPSRQYGIVFACRCRLEML